MSMKYGLLSLLALGLCLFAFFESALVWTRPLDPVSDPVIEKRSEGKSKPPQTIATQKDIDSLRSPGLIAEKNIFSPERKNFPVTSSEQSRQMVRPQVVLYGVTIAGDYQAASITSPGRPLRKGERETLILKVGEKMGEYKLAKVSLDRITLQNSNDTFEVLLYDSNKPKKRIEAIADTPHPVLRDSSPAPSAPSQPPAKAPPATPPQQAPVDRPRETAQQQVGLLPDETPQPPLPTVARPPIIDGKRRVYPH